MFSSAILALSLSIQAAPDDGAAALALAAASRDRTAGCDCGCAVTGDCKCADCPDGKPMLTLAPVVMQADPTDRIAALEARVQALEQQHAQLGLRAQPTMPVPPTMAAAGVPLAAGYQTQTAQAAYFTASSEGACVGGACAGGDCGAGGRSFRQPFGGRFRVRR
jgi:hypothetical protein